MDIINQIIGTPESYSGVNGCLSILKQNIISAESTEFPFRFTVNLSWAQEEINAAIAQITDYVITFDAAENLFTINKKDQ